MRRDRRGSKKVWYRPARGQGPNDRRLDRRDTKADRPVERLCWRGGGGQSVYEKMSGKMHEKVPYVQRCDR